MLYPTEFLMALKRYIFGDVTIGIDGNASVSNTVYTRNIAFAGMHVDDNSTAQSIPNGSTYTVYNNSWSNGLSYNCTPDATNSKITFTKTGIYFVTNSSNFNIGTNNVTFRGVAFLNGVEQHQCHWKKKVGIASDSQSASFSGLINVGSVGSYIELRLRHDNASPVNFTGEYISLDAIRVGDSQ